MKESYTANDTALSASSSHEKRDSYAASPPLVLQDVPEDDDEPPIRPPTGPEGNYKLHDYHVGHATHITVDVHPACNGIIIEKRPFDRDPAELAQYLHTSMSSGLDDSQVQNRLKLYGKNLLKGQGKVTVWAVLWRQVSNAMTVILLGALAIAFATQDFAEGGVIAGIPQFYDAYTYSSYRRCQRWYWILSGIPC
jgi:magnesium-transporting ATPase (P-type)